MSVDFEQISLKPGFMKHNGGLLFKKNEKGYMLLGYMLGYIESEVLK